MLYAVAAEGLSIRRAALMYGVPKSTLGYHVSGGRVLCGSMCERGKYLTNEEEELLTYVSGERPLLLILDGHSSHYCSDTIRQKRV